MKIRTLFVAALVGILATACNKENVIPEQDDMSVKTPITITATYGGNGAKVSYSESGSNITATWETDDELYVVYNGAVNTLTLSDGTGTSSATFTGTISGSPLATSMLICYVKDNNAPSAVTVNTDGSYTYTDGTFTSQDGTLASAAKCNLYYGVAQYGDGSDISCTFSVNTSMMKFNVATGLAENASVTLSYKSNGTTIASASFNVGADGTNTVYMAIPAGKYTGAQTLVCNDGSRDATATLSATQANFATGETYSKSFVYIFDGTRAVTATNGAIITGKGGANTRLTVTDGATVVLENVINGSDSYSSDWAGITCDGDAVLVINGTNTVRGFNDNYPGIYVPENKTLTIEGTGTLQAYAQTAKTSNGNAAGIGSGKDLPSGNIVINSGTIYATGQAMGAGIGGAQYGHCGNITINGGSIHANAAGNVAGIGAGEGTAGFCGTITITGGTISASCLNGNNGAGIGSAGFNECAGISISGGTITAKGGRNAAGIGSGNGGSCPGGVTITSNVTSVTATKGNNSTDIIGRGGSSATCGTVTIDGITDATPSSTFTHFSSSLSTTTNTDDTWTLTHN